MKLCPEFRQKDVRNISSRLKTNISDMYGQWALRAQEQVIKCARIMHEYIEVGAEAGKRRGTDASRGRLRASPSQLQLSINLLYIRDQ